MNDRSLVRSLKAEIARQIKHLPIFRDHMCRNAVNTFTCPICEIRHHTDSYPLAALSILRHFHFFDEDCLPQESDLCDLLGFEKLNRMIEEEQRKMFGTVKVTCKSCSHVMGFFDTYRQNLYRNPGTNFVFRCTVCDFKNEIILFKDRKALKTKKNTKTPVQLQAGRVRRNRNIAREAPLNFAYDNFNAAIADTTTTTNAINIGGLRLTDES